MSTLFSILICTYNGADRIATTLKYLANLETDDNIQAEVIVIDNNSTDNVVEVVEKNWKQLKYPFPLSIFKMEIPGKSYALALGVEKASGDFVIICDDDNWLQRDYLKVSAIKFRQLPKLGIAGGVTIPVSDHPLPDWFEKYAYYYACGKRAETEFDFTGGKFLWGAGMVISRQLALRITDMVHPQILSCRKEDELISGGDDELCLRTWLLGYRTVFFPDLVLQHFMAKNRLTVAYRDRLLAGFSVQSETVNAYRVLYLLQQRKKWKILFVKKIIHLVLYEILNDKQKVKIIKDNLFFLTNGKLFKNYILRSILEWYNKNRHI